MGSNYATCIRQTDGSPVVRLGEGSAVAISADGKWVLSNVPTEPQQLVLYPTGAGQPRKLERGGIVSYESATIFPDGRRVLACGHETGHGTRCYVQSIEGGAPRPVTPEGTSGGIVSPDGKQILVEENEKGLMLYPVEGGAGRPVSGSTPEDSVVQWRSDGKSVLVTTFFDVPARIAKLDLATGRRDPYLTLGPPNPTGAVRVDGIAVSEDGRSHAYTVRRMSSHLFLVSGAR